MVAPGKVTALAEIMAIKAIATSAPTATRVTTHASRNLNTTHRDIRCSRARRGRLAIGLNMSAGTMLTSATTVTVTIAAVPGSKPTGQSVMLNNNANRGHHVARSTIIATAMRAVTIVTTMINTPMTATGKAMVHAGRNASTVIICRSKNAGNASRRLTRGATPQNPMTFQPTSIRSSIGHLHCRRQFAAIAKAEHITNDPQLCQR